jgi:hypothetical protein
MQTSVNGSYVLDFWAGVGLPTHLHVEGRDPTLKNQDACLNDQANKLNFSESDIIKHALALFILDVPM